MKTRMVTGLLLFWMLFEPFLLLQASSQDSLTAMKESAETATDYLVLSKIYINKSVQKAEELGWIALEKSKNSEDQKLLADAYKQYGIVNYYNDSFERAFLYFDTALLLYQQIPDSIEMANVYNNLGVLNSDVGRQIEAVQLYLKSLEIKRLINDSVGIGNTLNNIGALYYDLKAFNQALQHFNEAYIIAIKQDDKAGMLTTLNNIGLIYMETDDNTQALAVFNDCVAIGKALNSPMGIANSLHNIGNIYLNQSKPDSAMVFFERALNYYKDMGVSSGETYNGIGKVHFQNRNMRKAIESYNKTLEICEATGNSNLKLLATHNIFESYYALGDYKKAVEYLMDYNNLYNSVRSLHDSAATKNLQARFDLENKLQEIEKLQFENKLQEKILEEQHMKNKMQKFALHLSLSAAVVFLVLFVMLFRTNSKLRKTKQVLVEQNETIRVSRQELNHTNKALAEKEETLRTLINATPDIICLKDGSGRWIEANETILQVFELSHADFFMQTDLELSVKKPFFQNVFINHHQSAAVTWQKGCITRQDDHITTTDSKNKTYDVINVPLFNEDGSRKGLIMLGRDITDRKIAEENLGKALHKAEESDRLKTAFLSNMSHEIRTPLNAIIGFSDLLDDEELTREEKQTYIRLVYDNGNALLGLIDDIIDLARIESGEMKLNQQQTNISELFVDVYQTYKGLKNRRNKAHIDLFFNIPESDVVCTTDARKLRQILINLVDNALKFTEEGSITMGFSIEKEEEGQANLQLFVNDTGIGIPVESKSQIFKRFIKLNEGSKKLYPGTGLGLSIVQQFTQLMGGSVRIDSEENKGTAFIINLPVSETKASSQNAKSPKSSSTYNFSNKTILVVEDISSNLDLLMAILVPTGAKLITAGNGIDAINHCMINTAIDLVLMDIQLPDLDGLEASRQIKANRPELPLLAQTAFVLSEERQACLDAGCDAYLAKPLRARVVLPLIAEMLGLKEQLQS
jgi:PAS domain S-box-containing protein